MHATALSFLETIPILRQQKVWVGGWEQRIAAYLFIQLCIADVAKMYVQLPLRQWGAGNVYILVLSSWKVKNPIPVKVL